MTNKENNINDELQLQLLKDGLRIRTVEVSPLHIQLYLLREYNQHPINNNSNADKMCLLIKARGQRAAEEVVSRVSQSLCR